MSDDLTIQLFFLTSAVLLGVEAVKASGWRVWIFSVLCGLFAIAGITWISIKGLSPPAALWISDIATSPQSWFVLIVLGLVLIAVTAGRQQPVSLPRSATSLNVVNENSGRMQKIELALSHILWVEGMRISKEILTRWIDNAPVIPETHDHDGFSANLLQTELSAFNEYLHHAGIDLSHMPLANDYRNIMLNAAGAADTELMSLESSPSDLPPYEFREWFIARNKTRRMVDFMIRKRSELDEELMSYLSTLEEQKRNLEAKDRKASR